MAQKDNNPVFEFDPTAPLKSLIGSEYRIPGIKESSPLKSAYCMLVNERARRIGNKEKKIVVDILFKKAFSKLFRGESLVCDGCGEKKISFADFMMSPFTFTCKDSEECEKQALIKSLQEEKESFSRELASITFFAKSNADISCNNNCSNHPADNNDLVDDYTKSRLVTLKNIIIHHEESIKRVLNDTYGVCTDCGEEIDKSRMLSVPITKQCVECKEKGERKDGMLTKNNRIVSRNRLDLERFRY